MPQEGNVTADVSVELPKHLQRGAEQPQGRLKLVFLPLYAPQLNPDEQA